MEIQRLIKHFEHGKDLDELPIELLALGNREYTPDEKDLIRLFWRYIHRKEKSKHADAVREVLASAAKDEGAEGVQHG